MDEFQIKRPSAAEIIRKDQSLSVAEAMEKIQLGSSAGVMSTAIGDSIFGLNHRQTPGAVPINKDVYGLTFFTRPRLNLTTENLRGQRLLGQLLNQQPVSIQRIIRCLLDPELASDSIDSPLVDKQQAFIPMLTNHLITINGWPDVRAQFFTSPQGLYKEEWSLVDGITENYGAYDITATFRNLPGDPITMMFFLWCHYMSLVMRGEIMPYPDMIVQNEVDYNTRIYRLVLDSTKTRVQKIAACGAAFPVNAPVGASFNYESDRPLNASNDQISINFQCVGAMYHDPILVDEFNRTTQMFNGSLRDARRSIDCVKIPIDALAIFNNRGYPRINPDTYELEWYIDREIYEQRMPAVSKVEATRWIYTPPGSDRAVAMNLR